MREAAQTGYLNAMAGATYLVHKGVPFRTAHEKIGNAVRYALEKGVELGDLSLDELRHFGSEFGEDFYPAVSLQATLDCHDVIGGTATSAREDGAARDAETRCSANKCSRTGGGSCRCVRLFCGMRRNIYDLVNSLSGDGTLLKRTFAEICENVRDFTVANPMAACFSAAVRCTSTGRICARCAQSS